MSKNPIKLMSLAAALAALSGTMAAVSPAADARPTDPAKPEDFNKALDREVQPNVLISVGKDLLGMVVTTGADGTVTAQHDSHYSHSSHASHSSHSSHYSSRY
jgi:hypothetical protein